MEIINVITAADRGYARHLGVMLRSLLDRASPEARFRIFVLDGGISGADLAKVTSTVCAYPASIRYLKIDARTFSAYPISEHIKRSAYYRISLHDYLDPALEKVLYLDCDIIVKDDISRLWETDLGDHVLAAVEDPASMRQEALSLPPGALYFNSGVMLINLVKWREHDVGGKAHDFIRRNPERVLLHDQDALNAVLRGQWLPLPPKWNQQTRFFHLDVAQTSFSAEEYVEALQRPALIHFTTSSKPWDYMNEHPFREEYHAQLQQTGWRRRFPSAGRRIDGVKKAVKTVLLRALAW